MNAPMPVYFFHVRNDMIVDDDEGIELADDRAALTVAENAARDLACESIRSRHSVDLGHRIIVEKAGGMAVGEVTFGEAFEIRGSRGG